MKLELVKQKTKATFAGIHYHDEQNKFLFDDDLSNAASVFFNIVFDTSLGYAVSRQTLLTKVNHPGYYN